MMDIDDSTRPALNKILRQNLHIAGEHNEIDAVVFEQLLLTLFGRYFRVWRYGDDFKRKTEVFGSRRVVFVVRHDQDDIARQFAEPLKEKQVIEAMAILAAKDGNAVAPVAEVELPLQPERPALHFQAQSNPVGIECEL